MKIVSADAIKDTIAKMCIEANVSLDDNVLRELEIASTREISPTAENILDTMIENIELADRNQMPICQDTGMAVVFITMGQNVSIKGGFLEKAINEGVIKGYEEGYLRKSVVNDPFLRNNTKTNAPAIIHYKIVEEDIFKIVFMSKGFGSENTSALKMLKPSEGIKGVEEFVVETVKKGASNSCAPVIVGVGVGGTFEKAAILAKEALARPLGVSNSLSHIEGLERLLFDRINNLGIGPMGLGGINTALGVNVEVFPTHIAGLPVAVNMCCYLNRHVEREL